MPDSEDITESTIRDGLDRTLWFQAAWMLGVGLVLIAIPSRRFDTPSWQFIQQLPWGDNGVGTLYAVIGLLMGAAVWRKHTHLIGVLLLAGGLLNWMFGTILALGALHGSTGGMGFPMAMYPGAHMLMTSAMLWWEPRRGR